MTSNRRLDLTDIQSVLGAISPDLARTDNKIMQLNGHPCDVFTIQTVGTAETNLNLQTNLVRVRGGVVKNQATGVTQPMAVTPLSTNASIAVVNGVLAADQTFIAVVYGSETR